MPTRSTYINSGDALDYDIGFGGQDYMRTIGENLNRMKNIQADTEMRESISRPGTKTVPTKPANK